MKPKAFWYCINKFGKYYAIHFCMQHFNTLHDRSHPGYILYACPACRAGLALIHDVDYKNLTIL